MWISEKPQVFISRTLFWSRISHSELLTSTSKVSAFLSSQTRKQRDRKAYSLISPIMILSSCPPLSAIFSCSNIYMEYRHMIHFTSVAPENLKVWVFYLSPTFSVPFLPLFILLWLYTVLLLQQKLRIHVKRPVLHKQSRDCRYQLDLHM